MLVINMGDRRPKTKFATGIPKGGHHPNQSGWKSRMAMVTILMMGRISVLDGVGQ